MIKKIFMLVSFIILGIFSLFQTGFLISKAHAASNAQKARALIRAYPSMLKSFDGQFLIWKDGTKMLFDDKKKKSFNQRLNHPDVEDMFYARYPYGGHRKGRAGVNQDPGRVRNEKFFHKLYRGKRIVSIPWLRKFGGKSIRVTTRFGIARKLRQISKELERLPLSYKKYLVPSAGGYNPRKIAGTNRTSVHSYGAAIDIKYRASHYWRHNKGRGFKNAIPAKIIQIFERHGFIWGGNWYHYDGFHFEYRPEFRYLR